MPRTPPPPPAPLPPRGVPRWLFPPPGAHVTAVHIVERVELSGQATYSCDEVDSMHLNALKWLLDEHERGALPPTGCPFEGEIRLAIARTELPGGRVGHAYALNDGPLGDPNGTEARGVLWRFVHAELERRR